ncbi:B-box type zinc finger family protein [Abeliophyllum distichum]|uniref:B-box type zinc finger family protein n=1 Tax=Abeliophyllum distichum TaxID=126358 RepID=A0ABD1UG33_9LAMI
MYCDSDQAILCWDCDARVHTANFLVAKHTRTLLCHVCQSLTPWTDAGPKLAPTVSVCESCSVTVNTRNLNINGDYDLENGDDDDEEDQGDDDHHDGSNDDEGDNQVVPLVSRSSTSESHLVDFSEEMMCRSQM